MLSRKTGTCCFCTTLLFFAVSCIADDFSEPMPPPELGETLTSYKTRQQLLDEAVRQSGEGTDRDLSRIKVYRDSNSPSGNVQHSGIPDAGTAAKAPPASVSKTIPYVSGRQYKLSPASFASIVIRDKFGTIWPLSYAEVSNAGFTAQMDQSGQKILIAPADARTPMSTLKVFLPGIKDPLVLILTNDERESPANLAMAVVVPYPVSNDKGTAANKKTIRTLIDTNDDKYYGLPGIGSGNISVEDTAAVADTLRNAFMRE